MNGSGTNSGRYKLIYFEDRGKTDLIKLLFAVAGQSYEDIQIKPTEWSQYKPYMPFEQLPVLVINDQLKISQPGVICRYLAQELRLNGDSKEEAVMCDMIVEQIRELVDASTHDRRTDTLLDMVQNLLPKCLSGLEKILSLNNTSYIVGE